MEEGRKRVYLHIGGFKTGSTFLQRALQANGEALGALGYLVPASRRPLQHDHHNLAWEILEHRRFDPSGFTLERLRRRIEAAPQPRVLISSEFFSRTDADGIRSLVERLGEVDLRVVLVVRNQVDTLQALYSEAVSHYRFTPKPHFLSRHLRNEGRLRYELIHRRWSRVLGPDRVRLLCYETVADDLLRAFLQACDLELDRAGWGRLRRPPAANVSKGLGYLEIRRWHQAALADERLVHRRLLLLFTDALARAVEREGEGRKRGSYLTQQEATLVAEHFAPHNEALRQLLPDLPACYFEPPRIAAADGLPDQEAVARAYVGALDSLIGSVPLLRSRRVQALLLRFFGSPSQRRTDSEEALYQGGVVRIRPHRLEGWVVRSLQPAPLQLELAVNGETVAGARADLPVPAAWPAAARILGGGGFRFLLPDHRLCPGDRISIRDCERNLEALAAVVPESRSRRRRRKPAEEASDDPGRPDLHHA